MGKYRKLPAVIEAEQWFPGNVIVGVEDHAGRPLIKTLEGYLEVSPGDWIITGVKGERYPCRPDIFNLTYELADAPQ